VIRAIKTAKEKGMTVIGFLGKDGGRMKELCDIAILVPSNNTQRIQEGHITIGHIISELVEIELYGEPKD
jgi:D-sedoheptulose 7-phosphate isomerase